MDPVWIFNLPASAWSWISSIPTRAWSGFKSITIQADKGLRAFAVDPTYYITATTIAALLGIAALALVVWGEAIDSELHNDAGKVLIGELPAQTADDKILVHNRKAKAMKLKAYARVCTACAIIATALGLFWKP